MSIEEVAPCTDALHPQLVRGLQELFGLSPRLLVADADLEQDLQLDSLATAELRMWVEDRLGVRFAVAAAVAPVRTLSGLQAALDAALDRAAPVAPSPGGHR